jgi:hypothetical protein
MKSKPKEFYYRPISYDPDLKNFRDKVSERVNNPESKKFDFRKHQRSANRKDFQKQLMRFGFVLVILIIIAYLVFTSSAIDNFANWLVNA